MAAPKKVKPQTILFICLGDDGIYGVGPILDAAYQDYNNNGGDCPVEDCEFFIKPPLLEVEQKIIQVETITASI